MRNDAEQFQPLPFSIDPDFENFVGPARMLNQVYRADVSSAIVEPVSIRAFCG